MKKHGVLESLERSNSHSPHQMMQMKSDSLLNKTPNPMRQSNQNTNRLPPTYMRHRGEVVKSTSSEEIRQGSHFKFGTHHSSASQAPAFGAVGPNNPNFRKQNQVRVRGKQYNQVKENNFSMKDIEQKKKLDERKKLIRRSNERLRMLDQMGRDR